MATASEEAARRRTFAIISHPDAGKTTLTEKFLLYGGALQSAGAVKARGERRRVTSDWMEMEQKRGISITSTVLQFPYRDSVLNLLDTPGHRDFSEDTYRVLAAADAAVMVLDAAKGIEPQTLKLFEVCRERNLPLLTFINKWDRPGPRSARAARPGRGASCRSCPTPVTWPVGIAGDFRGVVDRAAEPLHPLHPHRPRRHRGRRGGAHLRARPRPRRATPGTAARRSSALLDEVGAHADPERFRKGEVTPVFFGSALTNFGVRLLLDAVVDLAPPPTPRDDVAGLPRPLDAPFSAFVFKVQANMDPSHRDRIAFVRVCSGRFERGHGRHPRRHRQAVRHQVRPLGVRPGARHHRGGVARRRRRPRQRHRRHGRRRPLRRARRSSSRGCPSSRPEHFVVARVKDTGRFKQFRRGIAQLDEEGVVQVLRDQDLGDQAPILAAVGPMQFEVAAAPARARVRRADRAGAHLLAGRPQAPTRPRPPALRALQGVAVYAPGRRHPLRAVREPVLAGPGGGRPPRPRPRAARGRGHRRLVSAQVESQVVPSSRDVPSIR